MNDIPASNDAATNTAPDWTSGLADDLKSVVAAKGFRSPADLAAAYLKVDSEAAALLPPPKDGQWDDGARTKLGIPPTPAEYKIKRPELPDGLPYDETLEKAALPIAHKLGLMPGQVQGLIDFISAHRVAETKAALQTAQAQMAGAEEALRSEWGGAYERQVSLAARVAKRFGGDDLIGALNETGFGNNPHLVRAFAKIAGLVAEDTMKSDGSPTRPSADAALAEIARIQGEALKDPKHPWINAQHPEHDPRSNACAPSSPPLIRRRATNAPSNDHRHSSFVMAGLDPATQSSRVRATERLCVSPPHCRAAAGWPGQARP